MTPITVLNSQQHSPKTAGNQVGSIVATFTASDVEQDGLIVTLSDTTNYKSSLETFDSIPTNWTNAQLDSSTTIGSFLGRYKQNEKATTNSI